MKSTILIFALFLTSTAISAQETFKCTIGGSTVFQDRPCPGAVKRSADMPVKASPVVQPAVAADTPPIDPVAAQRLKTERDKDYIAERIKARNDEREKDQATEALANCEAEANSYTQRIRSIAANSPSGVPLNVANAMLDQQNRQTQIASLEAQASAKRSECDLQRQAFNQRWKR